MNTNPYYIIKGPVITEESTIQRDTKGHYTFRVDPKANKRQIKDAIERMFDVTVVTVNTMNYRGKRSGRQRRGVPGHRATWKKAVVALAEGDSIDLV